MQLGNLNLEDVIEKEYVGQIKLFLDSNGFTHESVCNAIKNKKGNYHIFDIPRLILICGENKMQEFIKFLSENDLIQKAFKSKIGLSYEKEN